MKKLLPYVVGILIVIGLTGAFFAFSSTNSKTNKSTIKTGNSEIESENESDEKSEDETSNSGNASPASPSTTYTVADVSSHNKKTDCWTIISGSVYDITSYVPRHPGGDDILRACGTDGTSLFVSRTTENGQVIGSGTGHSNSAESQLAELKIGIVAP